MRNIEGSKVIVIGASSGVGRATALALLDRGAQVVAVGRDRARLERLAVEAKRPLELRPLDATDPSALDALVADTRPSHIVLAAGTRAPMALVDELSWEEFSTAWNEDVKMAFEVGKVALRQRLGEGSTVVFVSSGAGLLGSPLSGGYAGAKRTQMFLAGYFQRASKEKNAGLRFIAVVPKQLIPDTETGQKVSIAYAKLAGISQEKFLERFEVPLLTTGVAQAIVGALEGAFPESTVVSVTSKDTELL